MPNLFPPLGLVTESGEHDVFKDVVIGVYLSFLRISNGAETLKNCLRLKHWVRWPDPAKISLKDHAFTAGCFFGSKAGVF